MSPLARAQEHLAEGRMAAAEASCRELLAKEPQNAEALQLLALVAAWARKHQVALKLIREAIRLQPWRADFYSNLGCILHDAGDLPGEKDAFQAAARLQPGLAQARFNLGNALRESGSLRAAAAEYRACIALNPHWPEALNNLGVALRELRMFDEAIAIFRKVQALAPEWPDVWNNLGLALSESGQQDTSITCFDRALELRPAFANAWNNLALAYADLRRDEDAMAAYERAIQIEPECAEAYNNLGSLHKDRAQHEEAVAHFRKAVELRPSQAVWRSNLIYCLQFLPAVQPGEIELEMKTWNRRFAVGHQQLHRDFSNVRDPERTLRIGYVSPDLRDHVVGRNVRPLLRHHDRSQYEIVCYSGTIRPDATTRQFQDFSNSWRETIGLSDDELAELIRSDGIDILVDLSLHTDGNRLPVFARKPAPVQISFAGYPGTSGVAAIDHWLADPHLVAMDGWESEGQSAFTFADSFWCYEPDGNEPGVNELPALSSGGHVTLGCLNNFCKTNDAVLDLWSQVLRRVPSARLLILAEAGPHRSRTVRFFEDREIGDGRVSFLDPAKRGEYMAYYHRIDIALDTFPYNGHTTTLDAIWMGVPVVTLAGDHAIARGGVSMLTNLGVPQLIAASTEEFARIVADLAGDVRKLAEMRAGLRDRLRASVIADAPRFARNIEQAYRALWRRWCGSGTPGADE